jgi:hypothetical protein
VPHNRRVFFDTLAKKRNFDPSQISEWLKLRKNDVYAEKVCVTKINVFIDLLKGGSSVMKYYGFSLVQALKSLYPEMKLLEDKVLDVSNDQDRRSHSKVLFPSPSQVSHSLLSWQKLLSGLDKPFFDYMANKKGFDPLISSNWYSLRREEILKEKVLVRVRVRGERE